MATIFGKGAAAGSAAPPGFGGPDEPAGLGELARELRERERRALLESDAGARERAVAEAEALRAQLDELAAAALSSGHSVTMISVAAVAGSDPRARFEAMGRLAASCARAAEIEELMVEEARALGGEMPAGRTGHFQRAMSRARFDLHAATRGAVLRGVPPGTIVEISRAAGLVLEEGDLAMAFEVRVDL